MVEPSDMMPAPECDRPPVVGPETGPWWRTPQVGLIGIFVGILVICYLADRYTALSIRGALVSCLALLFGVVAGHGLGMRDLKRRQEQDPVAAITAIAEGMDQKRRYCLGRRQIEAFKKLGGILDETQQFWGEKDFWDKYGKRP